MGNTNIDYTWSTHQPLIKLLLAVFNPKFVLELGIGCYSTPLFLEHNCEKIFIENNVEWIKKMDIPARHHRISIPNQDIPVHNIPNEQKQEIINYYLKLKEEIKDKECPKLLFVDSYSCCRALSINILYPVFDLIIYHDCEPQSINRNNYYFDKGLTDDFDHYNLVTPATWAGCFINNKLKCNEDILQKAVASIIKNYCEENGISGIYLQK